ncbi:MAG TPA: NEW3 domain-containing protein [Ohtaekwangia sp.]
MNFLSFLFLAIFTGLPTLLVAQASSKESSLTARLVNIEAAVHETFRYNATIRNGTSQANVYELKAGVPEGWNVVFRARGSQITSLNMDGNKSEEITIEIIPSYSTAPAKYKIPVTATTGSDTLKLDLEAVVKGSYGLELTTPTGRLSDNITEGRQKEIHLVVSNTGTLPLNDISLSAQTPPKWDATFEPAKVDNLLPGKTVDIIAKLSVPDKTLAGDYVTTFNARNTNSNAQAVFRMTVKTSMLSGWIGILVILSAIALVAYLIRKYGRR